MTEHSNRKYLLLNIFLLILEVVMIYLLKNEILAMEYGWEGRFNRYILVTVVVSQILFLYMIYQQEDKEQQRSMYIVLRKLTIQPQASHRPSPLFFVYIIGPNSMTQCVLLPCRPAKTEC